jgi:hypothetical protein
MLQVSDFVPNLGKFGAQQVPDVPAGMSTMIAQIKKLFDFLQRKPESLHLLNKGEPRYVIGCVEPELAHRPWGSRYKRLALVEADRIYAEFGSLRRFADLDCASRTRQNVRHAEIIHSGLYSRVKSALLGRLPSIGSFGRCCQQLVGSLRSISIRTSQPLVAPVRSKSDAPVSAGHLRDDRSGHLHKMQAPALVGATVIGSVGRRSREREGLGGCSLMVFDHSGP